TGGSGDGGDSTGPTAEGDGGNDGDDTAADDTAGGADGVDDGTGDGAGGTSNGAGTGGPGADGSDDGADVGCTCRASDESGVGGLTWALLALLALPRRRRRRAARVAALAASWLAVGCGDDDLPHAGDPATTAESSTQGSSGDDGTDDQNDPSDPSTSGADQGTTTTTGSPVDGTDDDTTAETGSVECTPYQPYFYDGFESYEPEESLSSNNPFGAAGRTRATDTVAHTGQMAARMEIRPEDDGGFGQWGGILSLPDVGVGGSVWVRLWAQWPSEFEFSASPWMKFIRLHNISAEGENAGYNDLYVDQADGPDSVLRIIKEGHDVWEVYDGPALPRDQWERYEVQIVVDHVPVDDGGQARFRVWRDDELIFDRTDVPTISAPGGVLD